VNERKKKKIEKSERYNVKKMRDKCIDLLFFFFFAQIKFRICIRKFTDHILKCRIRLPTQYRHHFKSEKLNRRTSIAYDKSCHSSGRSVTV